MRAVTFETLIGLLAVTGIRVGEAIRLDRDDIDYQRALLVVRNSKRERSREVPLHDSTLHALNNYSKRRDHQFKEPSSDRLLRLHRRHPALPRIRQHDPPLPGRPDRARGVADSVAARGCMICGTASRSHPARLVSRRRRRRTRACRCCRPTSATSIPANTYWYLSAAPELLTLVAARLDAAEGARP